MLWVGIGASRVDPVRCTDCCGQGGTVVVVAGRQGSRCGSAVDRQVCGSILH